MATTNTKQYGISVFDDQILSISVHDRNEINIGVIFPLDLDCFTQT